MVVVVVGASGGVSEVEAGNGKWAASTHAP